MSCMTQARASPRSEANTWLGVDQACKADWYKACDAYLCPGSMTTELSEESQVISAVQKGNADLIHDWFIMGMKSCISALRHELCCSGVEKQSQGKEPQQGGCTGIKITKLAAGPKHIH